MSINRNLSLLSSVTRQRTVEDEEEVERERRRKIRSYSSEPGDSPPEDVPPAFSSMEEVAEADDPEAAENYVEMLRVREERRRRRQMEALRQQREVGEGTGEGQEAKDENDMSEPSRSKKAETRSKRLFVSSLSISFEAPSSPTESGRVVSPISPTFSTGKGRAVSPISSTSSSSTSRVVSPFSPASSSSTSRVVSPFSPASSSSTSKVVSPLSPKGFFRTVSPGDAVGSPGMTYPVMHNGETQESQNESSTAEGVTDMQFTEESPFQRNNPRAMSWRMPGKKEEPSKPLQRSASVRVPSRAAHVRKALDALSREEDGQSPFQRNSRQRTSSRSIQEKMERLAMAVQKSENVRSPSASQKGVYVLPDEVARKRGLFERGLTTGDGASSRKDFQIFSAGITERINRWVARAQKSGFAPTDVRNKDTASKRNIWHNRPDEASPKAPPNK